MTAPRSPISGRVVAVDGGSTSSPGTTVHLANQVGVHACLVAGGDAARVGDLVTVDAHGQLRVRTATALPVGQDARWPRRVLDPRRLRGGQIRARTLAGIRAFFAARDFLETPTPVRVPSPGMEPHIRPFAVARGGFLQTSPEFAMKRLLVGGLERIYQVCPVFRDEPRSDTHASEFTMLEFYRAWADDTAIMADVEELVAALATAIHGAPRLTFAGQTIDVTPPWPRLTVRELFRAHAGVDPVPGGDLAAACARHGLDSPPDDDWDARYFRLWLSVVEPHLPADRPCFVTRYPASQAALARVDADPDGTPWARRFEVYAGGLELGNAFDELTDAAAQRARFADDQATRRAAYGDAWPESPVDEDFLGALTEGLPPSSGIALGVDRLVMLLADERDLAYTLWLPDVSPP